MNGAVCSALSDLIQLGPKKKYNLFIRVKDKHLVRSKNIPERLVFQTENINTLT